MKRIIINKPKVFLFLFIIFIFNSGLIIKKDESINLMREAIIDVYTVKKGDTLWSISNNYEYKNKMKFINDVEKLNNISPYEIKPGYKLAIPIYENK